MLRASFVAFGLLSLAAPTPTRAQESRTDSLPVIDTVIVIAENIFSPEEAATNSLFRITNGIRFKTRSYVVQREVLLKAGDRLDPALIAETARNLRSLGLFRAVGIDTARVDGKLALIVATQDGWSTQLQMNAQSTGGRFTWSAGLTENNFLGTGNLASAIYAKGVDRNSLTLATRINRLFGTRLRATGIFQDLSDGTVGQWQIGLPFRAFRDQRAVELTGEASGRRILQFRSPTALNVDTTQYWRRAFRNTLVAAYAPIAENSRYLRVGLIGEARREEYVLLQDTALSTPDSVFGSVGAFAEFRRANFEVVTYYNGFGLDEDLDLGTVVRVSARLAPSAFGYERTGIGPSVFAATGFRFPSGYARLSANANGLFNGAGLDSGRVQARMTVGVKPARRHATFLFVTAGAQDRPPPGGEFDLGFGGVGPRSFGPHAFTGTRTVWGTLEHRWFFVDDLYDILGIGLAGFLDYGGAWFEDQPSRAGGNVGFGFRIGANRSAGANTGRFDFGYRFGEGFSGKRWVFSFGRGFPF